MSISEIIQRRFKSQIQVKSANTPEEITEMILQPGEAANEDIDNNSWLVSLIDERRYPNMNGTIAKMYEHLNKRMPTVEELKKTTQQITDSLKQRLASAGNLILA
jgi:hypothetical protein